MAAKGWPKWIDDFDRRREESKRSGSEGGAAKKFLGTWMDQARGASGSGRMQAGPMGDVGRMHAQLDPWPSLARTMGEGPMLHRLVMGSGGGSGLLATTAPRRNLLVLGPPRSAKTVGCLVPSILSHPGPVVSTSTKDDVFRATAIVRARMGRLWHYNPDGGETLPGCIPLRWSPIPPSKDWSMAISLGRSMADVAEIGSSGGDTEYFRTKAGVLIAALLHAAAIKDKPMLWMLKAVAGDRRTLDEAFDILDENDFAPEAKIAAGDLQGIRDLDSRSQGPIFSTTANAFAAYRLPGALASTENPNFDPYQFAAGDPLGFNPRRVELLRPDEEEPRLAGLRFERQAVGVYDTVYLTASSSRQALVAPLVAGLLNQLREASFSMHRIDESHDYFVRPATLWALDEVAGIAPLRDLPETLSQSGGQGLLVAACIQDLQIARAKWDKAADSFLTLFGNVVVFPGIRDEATLRAISTVVGQHWVNVSSSGTSGGRSGGQRQNTWNETTNQQLVSRLEPGAVAQGRASEHPDYVLGLEPDGWGWFFSTPYYRSPPWPHLLVSSMEWAAELGQVFERVCDVPLPILNKDGSYEQLRGCGGERLVARYQRARDSLKELAEGRQLFWSHLGPDALLSGYDDSWTPVLRDLPPSYIALRDDPGPSKLNDALLAHPELRRSPQGYQAYLWLYPKAQVQTPFGDLPPDDLHPDWLIQANGSDDVACLTVVDGGLPAKVASGNTIITRHAEEIPGASVLIEVWATTRPGAHMAARLAADMAALSPVCWLTREGATFHGEPWRSPDGNDEGDGSGDRAPA
jgi:type IV secretion system protein VirD4